MNDNLLIAAVLREIAEAMERAHERAGFRTIYEGILSEELDLRAAELDPPEKNENSE